MVNEMSVKKEHKEYIYIFGLIYLLLPIMYVKAPIIFLMGLVVSFGIVFYGNRDFKSIIFKAYLWAFSFFGISIFSVKIFDIVMLFCLLGIIFWQKKIFFRKELGLIIPFYLFIIFQTLYMYFNSDVESSSIFLELGRYMLAFLTLFLFLQIKSVNKLGLAHWTDVFSVLVIVQAAVMFMVSNMIGDMNSIGPVQIQIFTDANESRVSAFFSDPNKMMCFFAMGLLLSIVLRSRDVRNLKWSSTFWIYLIGAVASLARTSVLIVGAFVVLFFYYKFFGKTSRIIANLVLLILGVFLAVLFYQNQYVVMSLIDSFFDRLLKIFGRYNTIKLDSNVASDSRVIVWKQAISYIEQRPLFGNGLLSEERLLPIPTHNTFVQLLLDTGIVGTVLYFVGLIVPLIKKLSLWIVFALIIIPMLFLDLANFRLVFVVFAFALQTYKKGGKETLV